jgi:hypothetical protein
MLIAKSQRLLCYYLLVEDALYLFADKKSNNNLNTANFRPNDARATSPLGRMHKSLTVLVLFGSLIFSVSPGHSRLTCNKKRE